MVVFLLVGSGVIKAALDYNPHNAIGLDGALQKLAHSAYGPGLLGIVAVGLIGFALYCIGEARYRRSHASYRGTVPQRNHACESSIQPIV